MYKKLHIRTNPDLQRLKLTRWFGGATVNHAWQVFRHVILHEKAGSMG
jgi:hypothetical protein